MSISAYELSFAMDSFHQDSGKNFEAAEDAFSQLYKHRGRMRACPDQYASALRRKGHLARFLQEFRTMQPRLRLRVEEIGGLVLPKGDLQIRVSLLSGVSWDVELTASTWLPLRLCDLKERLACTFQIPAACQFWLLGDLTLHDSMLVGDVFWDCNGSKVQVTMLKLQPLTWDEWSNLNICVYVSWHRFRALDQMTLARLALGIVNGDGGTIQTNVARFVQAKAQHEVGRGADQAPALDSNPHLEVVVNEL